ALLISPDHPAGPRRVNRCDCKDRRRRCKRGGNFSLFHRSTAVFFDVRAATLDLQTVFAGRASGVAGLARLGHDACLYDHVSEFLKAILFVPLLIAKSLRSDNQIAFGGDSVSLLAEQARFDIIRQACATGWIPAEHGLGCDLVDVLAPRPAGA